MAHYPLYTQNLSLVGVCVKRIGKAYSKAGTLVELPNYPIDLPHIQDVMEGIGHFFDGADAQLDGHCSAADW